MNVGSIDKVNIGELARLVVEVSGKEIKIEFDTTAPTGAPLRMPDLEKVQNVLGWSPKTDLKAGVGLTYEWVEKRLGGLA